MTARSSFDAILDRSVIFGYTNVGYRVRQALGSFEELPPMRGKVVLVTGASSGVGLAAAEGFARLGARVLALARGAERLEQACGGIVERTQNTDVHALVCDLSDLRAVRRVSARLQSECPRLDVLVNNAGVLPVERTLSHDGVELAFATNVLGPFVLTALLVGLLRQRARARVVNVSSAGMYTQRLHATDPQMTLEPFDGATAYARAKRAQVVLTELWARRLASYGIVVHAMHPGWVDTPGLERSLPRFYRAMRRWLRTPQQGADTIVWLGASPECGQRTGGFWHDRRPRPTHWLPWEDDTPVEREQLWHECERLGGLTPSQLPAAG